MEQYSRQQARSGRKTANRRKSTSGPLTSSNSQDSTLFINLDDQIICPTHIAIFKSQPMANPYTFKPRSYGIREPLPFPVDSAPVKKQNSDLLIRIPLPRPQQSERLLIDSLPYLKFRSCQQPWHSSQSLNLSLPIQSSDQQIPTPITYCQIEIVDNRNQRVKINSVRAYTFSPTQLPKENPLLSVSNALNTQNRNKAMEVIPFIKDYKQNYDVIKLQYDDTPATQVQGGRKHFIRGKQAALSLPRTCGVSYIKPSQSTQTNPLPPLIFQCSSECQLIQNSQITSLATQIFEKDMIVVRCKEAQMRNLLLNQKVGEIGICRLKDACQLIQPQTFHLFVPQPWGTQQNMWQSVFKSEIKIGILGKRGICSKRAVFKSLGIDSDLPSKEEKQEICEQTSSSGGQLQQVLQTMFPSIKKQISALSVKLQVYVQRQRWFQYQKSMKEKLNFFANQVQRLMTKQNFQTLINRLQKKSGLLSPFLTAPTALLGHKISSALPFGMQFNQSQIPQRTRSLNQSPIPLYYISTRDSFAYDLVEVREVVQLEGRTCLKISYQFEPNNFPESFRKYQSRWGFRIGVTSYHDFYKEQQLNHYQAQCFKMQQRAFRGNFIKMTVQPTVTETKLRRTKFFFGYRYMWTRNQLLQPFSFVAAGVRKDVSATPRWVQELSEPLIKTGIIQKNFINSAAVNVYHDGKQGLAQHFDDAVRFKQPIFTVRLFSDARLSFGSQFYGFCNGAFIVPLPRGCICVMEQGSFAANGVKHCVRPVDMTGKSAAVILRQMHKTVVNQSAQFDELIDFPTWFSTLSKESNGVDFSVQKEMQALWLDR